MYCNDILILQNGYFGVHTVFYTKLTIYIFSCMNLVVYIKTIGKTTYAVVLMK